MEQRQTKVTCPCCESRLEVDVRTGQVLKWGRKTELDETGKPVVREEDWDEASGRVSGRLTSAADKFEDSLAKEKSREHDLDDLFRKANERARRPEDD